MEEQLAAYIDTLRERQEDYGYDNDDIGYRNALELVIEELEDILYS